MSYRYYNANALGKLQSDCFLRSLSCATGKSWDYVYEHISDIAQMQGMMMDNAEFVLKYLDRIYKRVPFKNGMTIGEVSTKYKYNILLITTKGHIVCSKYGNVYDTFDSTNRLAEYAWIVN